VCACVRVRAFMRARAKVCESGMFISTGALEQGD
jgi:hypothetical protein